MLRSTLRCALIVASLFATSASAADLWATTQDSLGFARASQYDLATGNVVQGNGIRFDANLSGDDNPFAWDRIGSIAFDPDGKLWATTRDSLGFAQAIQYDLASGNVVQGIRFDANLSGDDSPFAWDRIGSIAFDPDGKLWATTRDSLGLAQAIQYDLASGNVVQGIRFDANLSGDDSPFAWDSVGSITFDPDGKLWAATKDSLGFARASQYDLATGNVVPGKGLRFDANLSGDDSPFAWDRLGSIAFRPDGQVAAVPEPATWAMMILGFAVVGATARQRSRRSTAAQAS